MGIFIASSHPIPVGRVPLLAPPWLKPLINPLVHAPAIEDEYSGPKLEDGKVTITFMKELMQWYKEQKKLHRKCAYQVTHTHLRPGNGPATASLALRMVVNAATS